MKKIALSVLVLIGLSSLSLAQVMDTRTFTITTIGTNVGSQAFVLRGDLEAVYVDVTANKTQTVAVATSYGTALSESFTADGLRLPRAQIHNTAGVAQTVVDAGANTNAVFTKFPMAGTVTVTVTPAANTTGTNTTSATIIYKP
jgi:hypothetical protein